jgi:hypothetical protein
MKVLIKGFKYIFRSNNELLISKDGSVEKGSWEYLGNNSLLIDQKNNSFLFNNGFLNDKVMALKIDGKNEYAILLNENKIDIKITSFDDITRLLKDDYDRKYLSEKGDNKLEKSNEPILSESTQKVIDTDLTNTSVTFLIIILIFLTILLLMAGAFANP